MGEEILESMIPLFEVDVVFDRNENPPLRVLQEHVFMPPGLSLLMFKLHGDASFLSSPLQWMENQYGLGENPPRMRVSRLDAQTVIVANENKAPRGQARVFAYMLLAFSDGDVFATDPTIINIPPQG